MVARKNGQRANGHGIPLVAVDLDRKRHLRVDFNGLARVEEAAGIDLLQGQEATRYTPSQFRGIVWGLLAHEDPDLTLEAVGAMLHPGNMVAVAEALRTAVEGSVGIPKAAPQPSE